MVRHMNDEGEMLRVMASLANSLQPSLHRPLAMLCLTRHDARVLVLCPHLPS